LSRLWLTFAAYALVVLGAGWLATHSADTLAEQSGLGSAFVGATLLALATSLPELSTSIAASRRERYTTAIANVFGGNAFDIGLLFVADLAHRQASIFEHSEPTALFVTAIAAAMTCVYVWGLVERKDRGIRRLGWDSLIALGIYVVGMLVLYLMT
jgi:cation:H+ antiporter